MSKKTGKSKDVTPDSIFLVKEMGKKIKFILKLENLFQNRKDSAGYTCGKISKENPYFSIKLNDITKIKVIKELLSKKYDYIVENGEIQGELIFKLKKSKNSHTEDGSNKLSKRNFENLDSDIEDDPKLDILRQRYKKIIGAIRYHFPMSYGFNQNSSNGYRATRIKSSEDKSFFMEFPTSELTDLVSNFLLKNGHKTIRTENDVLEIFLLDFPDESPIFSNIGESDFSSEQLMKIWDMLNTNGLVLLDVNNRYFVLDLFNGKGLPHLNKEQFIKIIKNQ